MNKQFLDKLLRLEEFVCHFYFTGESCDVFFDYDCPKIRVLITDGPLKGEKVWITFEEEE